MPTLLYMKGNSITINTLCYHDQIIIIIILQFVQGIKAALYHIIVFFLNLAVSEHAMVKGVYLCLRIYRITSNLTDTRKIIILANVRYN